MNTNRTEEIEAIQVASEYCVRLENAINNAVNELNGNRQPDTDEYVKDILNGINWTIQVYNGVREYLGELGAGIDESAVNSAIAKLSEAFSGKDDTKKAEALGGEVLVFIQKMGASADLIK